MIPIHPATAAVPPPHMNTPIVAADGLREAAIKLEATFLSEMLKAAGLGTRASEFGGGAGEDQFGSFLRDAQAQAMAEAGGIGLAEALFHAMKVRLNGEG